MQRSEITGEVTGRGRSWSGRPGSNRRHSAWEADVLPLNYSRFDSNYIAGQRVPASKVVCYPIDSGRRSLRVCAPGSARRVA